MDESDPKIASFWAISPVFFPQFKEKLTHPFNVLGLDAYPNSTRSFMRDLLQHAFKNFHTLTSSNSTVGGGVAF